MANGKIIRMKHFIWEKNDVIFHIINQIKVQRYLIVKSDMSLKKYGGSRETVIYMIYQNKMDSIQRYI